MLGTVLDAGEENQHHCRLTSLPVLLVGECLRGRLRFWVASFTKVWLKPTLKASVSFRQGLLCGSHAEEAYRGCRLVHMLREETTGLTGTTVFFVESQLALAAGLSSNGWSTCGWSRVYCSSTSQCNSCHISVTKTLSRGHPNFLCK